MSQADLTAVLGRTLAFTFAAGINLYATVAILGLAMRYAWVDLPSQYRVFDNNWIIGLAIFLYVVEFIADKIPWVDTLWDGIHTAIRPVGGALIAVASIGQAQPSVQALAALAGALLATSTHVAKASTRALANTSPEPFSNWTLSLAEDGLVLALGFLALTHPLAATIVVAGAVVAMVLAGRWLFRSVRRRLRSL